MSNVYQFKSVFNYSKEDAEMDGIIVNLTELFPAITRKIGFTKKIYCSINIYQTYIRMNDYAIAMNLSLERRAHDILLMAMESTEDALYNGESLFPFFAIVDDVRLGCFQAVLKFDGDSFIIIDYQK